MAKVKVTQIRSLIGRNERQKMTIRSLGLGKINRSVEIETNPAMLGMINAVSHLVKVEPL